MRAAAAGCGERKVHWAGLMQPFEVLGGQLASRRSSRVALAALAPCSRSGVWQLIASVRLKHE